MPYEGEHLLIGQIGHFMAILAFAGALVGVISYYQLARRPNEIDRLGWRKMGRTAFFLNVAAIVGIFLTLYLIIYHHYFEYKYAHQHSKRSLDMQYLLSCFWEGQEGSFMLWSFWNSVLGLILIRTAGRWEGPVMAVMSLAQLFLATFLIGIYFFDIRIGSSPFVLMRNEFPDAPIFSDPQYLTKYLTDGNGLNILLQNYWMVIHPPVLFLGFASALVPYAFAVAGMWTKDHTGWVKPALPWSLFAAGILGLGIMMGAAWAYESLTFGGYWAWDPVENASMVPWLILVAGIHTMLIFRHTGHSLRATYFFLPLSFLLVIYSTFLTRTGVLGDTSVHSFTGEGNSLYWHLLLMITIFAAIPAIFYLKAGKGIPENRKEESMQSREFWMFVGSLLFFVSALYIIILTSLPLINKWFGTQWAIGEDVEYVYNRVMILVAFVLGILTAVTQFFRYRDTPPGTFWSRLIWPTVITLIVAVMVSLFGDINYNRYGPGFQGAIHATMWAGLYTIFANGAYVFRVLKGKLKAAGASIAHIGFGLMIVGILFSSAGKELISVNKTGIAVPGLKDSRGRTENPMENITLIHQVPTPMGNYTVTYEGDSTESRNNKVFFKIRFEKSQPEGQQPGEMFYVYPDAFLVKSETGTQLSSNPGSRHYLTRDIFVYITSWLNPDNIQDTARFRHIPVTDGDTVFYSNGMIIIDKLIKANRFENADLPLVDSAWLADLRVISKDQRSWDLQPAFFIKDKQPIAKTDTLTEQNLILQFGRQGPGEPLTLGVRESDAVMRYITLKAYRFPFINILWLGTILMVAGFMLSAWYRIKKMGTGAA